MNRPRGTGSLKLRGKIWWIVYSHERRVDESSHSSNIDQAKKLLAKRLGQLASGQFAGLAPEKTTIADLADLVIQDYEHARRRSLAMVKYRIKLHIRPELGFVRAARFGPSQVKKYVAIRRRQGAQEATINRELAIVRRGFTLASQCDPPLVTHVPYIEKLYEDNVRQGFVEHDQYRALLEKLPPHLKCLLVVGYHVGCRLGELRKLRWEQVDISTGEIRLTKGQTKGKAPRTAPIYADMVYWLKFQREARDQEFPDCPWVFHYLGRHVGTHVKGWNGACEAAGLPASIFMTSAAVRCGTWNAPESRVMWRWRSQAIKPKQSTAGMTSSARVT
jgi:integrase